MLCKKPFLPAGATLPVPCGQCMPCRIKHRKLWTSRLILESMVHSKQCFVTLTYADANLPPGGNLVPADAVLWLKRLRKAVFPAKLRYYLVGEYGEKTWRPHYHALLFGLPFSVASENLLRKTWTAGFVSLGEVNPATIKYTVGYVVKKMTRLGDSRLDGRVPEFGRMSRMPGIGHGAAMQLVRSLLANPAARSALSQVPTVVRSGSQNLMIGKYLREVMSRELNLPMVDEARREAYLAEVFDLCSRSPGLTLEEVVQEPQRAASLEARERIFNSKGKKL